MKQSKPPHKPPQATDKRAQPPALRAKLRHACELIADEGRTQRAAADAAGMDETALGRALRKPHVIAYIEDRKALNALNADDLMGLAKVRAIQRGIELLNNSTSDAVTARMVEFFAGERSKGAQIQVNVDARSGGYEFIRPGQQVVEIKANPAPKATPTDS